MIPLKPVIQYEEGWPVNCLDCSTFDESPGTPRGESVAAQPIVKSCQPITALTSSSLGSVDLKPLHATDPIIIVVTSDDRCTLTARFFCTRLLHYLHWCGESARLFVASPDYREHHLLRWEENPVGWAREASRCIRETIAYFDSDPPLGFAATPLSILYLDCASAAVCQAFHALIPAERSLLFRHVFFGEDWVEAIDECSFTSVNFSTSSLRATRCRGSVICSAITAYLCLMLASLRQIYAHEAQEGSPLGGLQSLTPIFFARHGQSEYNLEDRLGGYPNLTPSGVLDSQDIAAFFKQQVASNPLLFPNRSEQWDRTVGFEVWCSQLRRTQNTAQPCADVLCNGSLRAFKSLNEIHAGICEDMTHEEVKQLYPYIGSFRHHDKVGFRYPNGESYRDLMTRLTPLLLDLYNDPHCVLVVAHQAVLRTALSFFGGPLLEEAVRLPCPQRTVWICTYNRVGEPRLTTVSLPPAVPPPT